MNSRKKNPDHEAILRVLDVLLLSTILGPRFSLTSPTSDFFDDGSNCLYGTIEGTQAANVEIYCANRKCSISIRPDIMSAIPSDYATIPIDEEEQWLWRVETWLWNFIREHYKYFVTDSRPFTPSPTPSPSPEHGSAIRRTSPTFYNNYNEDYESPEPQPIPGLPYREQNEGCEDCECTDCYHGENPRCPCVRNSCVNIIDSISSKLIITFIEEAVSKHVKIKEFSCEDIEKLKLDFTILIGQQYKLTVYVPEELNPEDARYVCLAIYVEPKFENKTFLELVKCNDHYDGVDEIVKILTQIVNSQEFLPLAPTSAPAPAPSPSPSPSPAPTSAPAPAPESKACSACSSCVIC